MKIQNLFFMMLSVLTCASSWAEDCGESQMQSQLKSKDFKVSTLTGRVSSTSSNKCGLNLQVESDGKVYEVQVGPKFIDDKQNPWNKGDELMIIGFTFPISPKRVVAREIKQGEKEWVIRKEDGTVLFDPNKPKAKQKKKSH